VVRTNFDQDYYRRFYDDDPVHTRHTINALATGVHSLAVWWGIPIERVLDVGAGPGYWRDWYRNNHPSVKVTSIDVSQYACDTYGHEKRDISTWRPRSKHDLIICHGVLHYLPNDAARAAIANIAHSSRALLYLEAPTAHDLEHVVDQDATDLEVHHRSARWYKTQLSPHFQQIGAGLWIHRSHMLPLYELERA
jgi:SAM-dependent methyltransferase